jgi:hypothetical protein
VLCLLRAVCWQSVGEARLLLRDWLVIFTTNYHRNSYMRASAQQLLKLPVRHTEYQQLSADTHTHTHSINNSLSIHSAKHTSLA